MGVIASPPSAVSFSALHMLSPTDFIAWIHSSTGILLSIPARAISAAVKAMDTPETLRLIQGIYTKPATGSHTSPSWFLMAMAQAWPAWVGVPPHSSTRAAAAMEEAEPHSA